MRRLSSGRNTEWAPYYVFLMSSIFRFQSEKHESQVTKDDDDEVVRENVVSTAFSRSQRNYVVTI